MLVSAALAIILPFEIFLLSYAILGPLHYLTEISWLHKKQYFVPSKKDYFFLMATCLVVALVVLMILLWPLVKDQQVAEQFLLNNNLNKKDFETELSSWPASLIFLVFATAFILCFVKDWWFRINAFVVAFIVLVAFRWVWSYSVFFGALLTTVIHVWVFTGIFILSGAIRSKALLGYISFVVFLLCSIAVCLISKPDYVVDAYAANIFSGGSFAINEIIFMIFNVPFEKPDLMYSAFGLKVQAFLAYAYTYHYLNWFAKIDIIKWNQVPKKSLILSVAIWIASIALYAYDYKVGFYFLLFLSMLHVFLEFPLNFQSIVAVVKRSK